MSFSQVVTVGGWRGRSWLLLLGLLLLPAVGRGVSSANVVKPRQYLVDVWQGEQGLPQTTVTGIAQTPDGFLWVSTLDGIARFDGSRFRMFKAGNAPALGTGRIRFLFPGRAGSFWLAIQEGEVVRFRDGQFVPLELPASKVGWPTSVQVIEDQAGAVWLSLEDRTVGWLAKGGFSLISTNWDPTGRTNFQVRADNRGELWAISRTGLYRVEGGQLAPALQGKPGEYTVHCPARAGGWWVGTGNQLRWWRDGQWLATLPGPTNAPAALRCSLEDSHGRVWIGSIDQGLFCSDTNGTLQQFTIADGLSSDSIRALFEDGEGNLWVGTEGGGLNRLRTPRFRVYGQAQGIPPDLAVSVSAGREGDLWIGTDGIGLKHLAGESAQSVAENSGDAPLHAMTVAADRQGRVLLATRAGGIFRYSDGQINRLGNSVPAGLPARSVFEDSHGVIWLGWRNTTNLTRIQGNQVGTLALPESLPALDVRVMAEDASGALWIGTDGQGLLRWKQGEFKRFTKAEGLGSDFIWSLRAEPDGTLWVGTYGGGLTRLKAGRAKTATTADGLVDDVICDIEADGDGQFWFSSNQGIFRAGKVELNEFFDGAADRLRCVAYGKSDGLPALQCRGGYQASGCALPDGRIVFLTFGGLVEFNPRELAGTKTPPRVFIDEIKVDDEAMAPRQWREKFQAGKPAGEGDDDALRLPPGSRRFQFNYTAVNFDAPERLRFRHKLEGVDADWVDSSGQRTVSYTRLSSGTYRFQVQACNREGAWSRPGAAISFTILPHFWQTWWFVTLFLLVFGGVVGVGVGNIVRRRQQLHLRLLGRLHAAERERTRIARDIHDDLGSSLTEIGYIGALGVRDATSLEEAREHLERIMERTRELVKKVDETVWVVSPKHDSPDHLATYLSSYARELLETVNVRCRLDVALNLPEVELTTESRHSVFLAVKEALNNALRHSGATEVTLRIAANGGAMTIEVSDNGRGFTAPAGGDGNGLRNMASRMEDIGGRFDWRSAPGQGTTIILEIPLRDRAAETGSQPNLGRDNGAPA